MGSGNKPQTWVCEGERVMELGVKFIEVIRDEERLNTLDWVKSS